MSDGSRVGPAQMAAMRGALDSAVSDGPAWGYGAAVDDEYNAYATADEGVGDFNPLGVAEVSSSFSGPTALQIQRGSMAMSPGDSHRIGRNDGDERDDVAAGPTAYRSRRDGVSRPWDDGDGREDDAVGPPADQSGRGGMSRPMDDSRASARRRSQTPVRLPVRSSQSRERHRPSPRPATYHVWSPALERRQFGYSG